MKPDRKKITGFARDYCVTKGRKFRLRDIDPGDTGGVKSEKHAKELLAGSMELMSEMQEKLYAQDRWSLLLIFQAMDAAGKDGTIKHVMSGINPQGCEVTSFKSPSTLELNHDFLWRSNVALPERGRIGIFNRSYYEEVLVVRVHGKLLEAERIPARLVTKHIWEERFEDINAHERYLTRNGVVIRKFFLHVSKAEQKRRFLSRLDESSKNWKFSGADLKERAYWRDYMEAYEEMIGRTATPDAPWYVVPADNKWFTHMVVAGAIIETLDSLGLAFPEVTAEQCKILEEARKILRK
ncbi:MAG TPA: polyphosphate kinase 2 family protein [Candidatus Methylacidiphilales bacterium]|jgi:PPK2 family polyphosphate:nucleotide phosphotransferase|nr:polyphosphate kinase 2 family protein [Candidatus Methylacidiphilales bacterium]